MEARKKSVSEKGFTLIEIVVVSFVAMIILSFPVLSFKRVQEQAEIDLFLEQLVSSLTLIQNQAILNNDWTEVEISPEYRRFRFRVIGDRNHRVNHTLELPESVSLTGGIKRKRFLSGSGNLGDYSPIHLYTANGRYEIDYKFGSGRFEIKRP